MSDAVNFQTLTIFLFIYLGIFLHELSHILTVNRFSGKNSTSIRSNLCLTASQFSLVGSFIVPVGTLTLSNLVLGVTIFSGWAKPIKISKKYKLESVEVALVALSGPISNLVMACIGIVFFQVSQYMRWDTAQQNAQVWVAVNLAMAVFNLLPFRPLDGYTFLRAFLTSNFLYIVQTIFVGIIVCMLLYYFDMYAK